MLLLALLLPLVGAEYRPYFSVGPSFSRNNIHYPPGHHLEHLNNNGQFRPSVVDVPILPDLPNIGPTISDEPQFFSPILRQLRGAKPLPAFKYNEYLKMNKQAGCHAECMLNLRLLGEYYGKTMDDVECISHCYDKGPVRPTPGPQPVNPILPQPVRPVVPVNPPKGRFYYAKLNEIPDAMPLSPEKFNAYAINPKAGCFEECMNNLQKLIRYFKNPMGETDCVSECFSSQTPSVPKPNPYLPGPNPIRPGPIPHQPADGPFYYTPLNQIHDENLKRLPPGSMQHLDKMKACTLECMNNLQVLIRYYKKPMEGADCVGECMELYPATNGVTYPHRDHTHTLPGPGEHRINGNNVPGIGNNTLPTSRLGRIGGLRVYGGH